MRPSAGVTVPKLRSIFDRHEIEALRAAYTEALMGHQYSRVASLFTNDGVLWTSQSSASVLERDQIRSWLEQHQELWMFLVQTSRSGGIELDGNTAVGRDYLQELMRSRDGNSQLKYGVYHDRYRRTTNGWMFTERRYEVRHRDIASLLERAPAAVG